MTLEVCGSESFSPVTSYFSKRANKGSYHDTHGLDSFFTADTAGSSCTPKEYILYNDSACTVAWDKTAIAEVSSRNLLIKRSTEFQLVQFYIGAIAHDGTCYS